MRCLNQHIRRFTVSVLCTSDSHFPEDPARYVAAQEACSCFRQQIFTECRAKENVSVPQNKVGGEDLWKCCCARNAGLVWPVFLTYFCRLYMTFT